MWRTPGVILLLFLLVSPLTADPSLKLEAPARVLAGVPFTIKVEAQTEGHRDPHYQGVVSLEASDGSRAQLTLLKGSHEGKFSVAQRGPIRLVAVSQQLRAEHQLTALPGWTSLLPPLLAILLALTVRQVLLSLLAGIWLGASLLSGGPLAGYCSTLDHFLIGSLANQDHCYILLFTLSLGGLVSLVSRSGGMLGLVDRLQRYATGYRSSQVATWAMGLAIFFDDYANTLLVGNTMRPLTDRFRISREKLAYIVDSTAAPISSIAVISTWIGYEMSLIDDSFRNLGINKNVYEVFLESIVHRYYAIFALAFVLAVALLGRDFGPMLKAERRAANENKLLRDGAKPLADPDQEANLETLSKNPWNAIVPIGTVLLVTLGSLYLTGTQAAGPPDPNHPLVQQLGVIFGESNSYKSLLWASFAGGLVAFIMILSQRLMTVEEAVDTYVKGILHMTMACLVLVLAWAIGDVCKELYTAGYLVNLTEGLTPRILPFLTFLISAGVAFATGSSWSTMAIMMPVAIELAYTLPEKAGLPQEISWTLMVGTIAGVLAGATFGDHCSPISDTTIMSSMASACDHVDHVNTQAPYAMATAALACLLGCLPAAWGISPWLLNIVGIAACFGLVWFIGKPVRENLAGDPAGSL